MSTLIELLPAPPPIDYDSRDYESIVESLLRAKRYYTPDWTDENPSDFGIVLLQMKAYACDVLHYYIDRAAAEAFLTTAIKRESVVNLLKLIGYELRSASPGSVDCVFTLPQTFATDVPIPALTVVSTPRDRLNPPITFETVEDLIIPAGQLEGTVSVVEGTTVTEEIGTSDGTSFQRFELTQKPVIDGTQTTDVDEGAGPVEWTEVDDKLATSNGTDRNYYTQNDEEDSVTAFFGDNAQGRIPATSADITSTYRIGGGPIGNVGAGTINTVVTQLTHEAAKLTVAVTNPKQASGGEARETTTEAKLLGPLTLRALGRAVALPDFKFLAEDFPGIAVAEAFPGSTKVGGCCGVTICATPTGGGPLSQVLQDNLLAFFDQRVIAGTCVELCIPTTATADIVGTVFVQPGFTEAEVIEPVLEVMSDIVGGYFDLTGQFIGYGLDGRESDIFRIMDSVPGVDFVELRVITRRPIPSYDLWAGTAVLDPDFDEVHKEVLVGSTAIDEVWTVTMVSPTDFSVSGSVSGPQILNGTIGVPYISEKIGPGTGTVLPAPDDQKGSQLEGASIAFTILEKPPGSEDPVVPPVVGERLTFRTSERKASIPVDPQEILVPGSIALQTDGGSRRTQECGG